MAKWYKTNLGKAAIAGTVGLGAVQGLAGKEDAQNKLNSLMDYYNSLDSTLQAQYADQIAEQAKILQSRIDSSGGLETIQKYNEMVEGYDPNKYIYQADDFAYTSGVGDFLDPSADYRAKKAMEATQQSLAGQGSLFSGGAGRRIASEQSELASEEYAKSYDRLVKDKETAYKLYRDKIADTQAKLNAQETGYVNQMNLYGGLKKDIYNVQDTVAQQKLAALQQLQQNKLLTAEERAQITAQQKELGSGFWSDVNAGIGGWQGEAEAGSNLYGSLYGFKK
jgi:hypothetical protein